MKRRLKRWRLLVLRRECGARFSEAVVLQETATLAVDNISKAYE